MTSTTLSSIDQFRSSGAIVSREPVKKHIEWTAVNAESGDEVNFDADVYLIKPGAGLMSDMFGGEDKHVMVKAVHKCFMLPNAEGKLVPMTYDEVFQFDAPLLAAIWKELTVLAGMSKKNSPQPTNSSSNSPSTESAETQ